MDGYPRGGIVAPPEGLSKILTVLVLIDEYEEAVAYDLLRLGLRLRDLGTDKLTWSDVYTVVFQQPANEQSATYRALHPESAPWDIQNQLLALVADALHVANWQRAHGKKRDYPKPIPRPGVTPSEKTYGKGAIPIDEMADWLGWNT